MATVEADRDRRRDGLGLALVFAVGLAVRLVAALQYGEHPLGRLAWVDEGAYRARAIEIAGGAWLPPGPFYQDPLFPYLLALLGKAVGFAVPTLRLALAAIGSATPPVLYLAARRGFGRPEAVVAGLVAALYGPFVFADGLIEKEGLGTLFAALAILQTARLSSGGPRAAGALLQGLLWGAVALFRANALLILPVGLVWHLAAEGRKGRRLGVAAAYGLGFLLSMAPVALVNGFLSKGGLILTTWQAGANFYIGNGPEATGTYAAPDFVEANPAREAADFAAEAERRAGRPLSPGEVSRFWLGQGLKRWRTDPIASLRLLAWKLRLVANDVEVPDNQDAESVRLLAAPGLGFAPVGFGLIGPFAALGAFAERGRRLRLFLAASTLVGLLSTAAFFVVGRYRLPWTPGLLLLAAAGLVDAARRLRTGRLRSLGAAPAAPRPADGPARLLADPRAGAGPLGARPDSPGDRPGRGGAGRPGRRRLRRGPGDGAGPGESGRGAALGTLPRAVGSAAARRLETLRRASRLTDVRHARLLRQVPEGRDEARRRLDAAIATAATAAALHEQAAWWLGEPTAEARRRAVEDLAKALTSSGEPSVESALLLAPLTRNTVPLDRPTRLLSAADNRRIGWVRRVLAEPGNRPW